MKAQPPPLTVTMTIWPLVGLSRFAAAVEAGNVVVVVEGVVVVEVVVLRVVVVLLVVVVRIAVVVVLLLAALPAVFRSAGMAERALSVSVPNRAKLETGRVDSSVK